MPESLSGTGWGIAALALSLVFAMVYAGANVQVHSGFAGEVERQWRDDRLGARGADAVLYASGDVHGQGVRDPVFKISAKGVLLTRQTRAMQWIERCGADGACKVELGWGREWVDASKFKTPGYVNEPLRLGSLMIITRATVGKGAGDMLSNARPPDAQAAIPAQQLLPEQAGKVGLSVEAVRALLPLAEPYKVGDLDADLPGWSKVDGGYQNFEGKPGPGAIRATFTLLRDGVPLTVAGRADMHGDIAAKPGEIMASKGALSPPELLNLPFWRRPEFGLGMLALAGLLFAAGAWGLWSARKIELEMAERKRSLARARKATDAADALRAASRAGR